MENRLARLFRMKRIAILMTLDELASASGVPIADLRRMETGEYIPGDGCLERLASALGIKTLPANVSLSFAFPAELNVRKATYRDCTLTYDSIDL